MTCSSVCRSVARSAHPMQDRDQWRHHFALCGGACYSWYLDRIRTHLPVCEACHTHFREQLSKDFRDGVAGEAVQMRGFHQHVQDCLACHRALADAVAKHLTRCGICRLALPHGPDAIDGLVSEDPDFLDWIRQHLITCASCASRWLSRQPGPALQAQ